MPTPNIATVPFKSTKRIQLIPLLRDYISYSYGEHPDAYVDDFRILDELRSDCVALEADRNALNRLLK